VYCQDLLKLITHIRDVLSRDLDGSPARPAAAVG
jgi:uncharacterized protein